MRWYRKARSVDKRVSQSRQSISYIRLAYILITLRKRKLFLLLSLKSTSLRISILTRFIVNNATLRLRSS